MKCNGKEKYYRRGPVVVVVAKRVSKKDLINKNMDQQQFRLDVANITYKDNF